MCACYGVVHFCHAGITPDYPQMKLTAAPSPHAGRYIADNLSSLLELVATHIGQRRSDLLSELASRPALDMDALREATMQSAAPWS